MNYKRIGSTKLKFDTTSSQVMVRSDVVRVRLVLGLMWLGSG